MADLAEPPNPTPSRLHRITRHPWFALSGWLVGIIGIALTIVIFMTSSKHRLLTYAVNPTTTTIVQGGGLSDLHVSYKGQELGSDLTAVQILIWNAGKEPIRSTDVLDDVRVETSSRTRIIEAQLRGISRPAIAFTLDTSHASEGILNPHWRILEHNDGATIQLLLAGPASTTVTVRGIIEGQGDVAHEIRVAQEKLDQRTINILLAPLGVAAIWLIVTGFFRKKSKSHIIWMDRMVGIMFLYMLLLVLGTVGRMVMVESAHPSFASW